MAEYAHPPGFDLSDTSLGIRRFYRDFFADPVAVLRREADLDYLTHFDESERRVATQLLRLNLNPLRSAVLEGIGQLRIAELVPELTLLRSRASNLSRKIEISRTLCRVTGDSQWIREPLQDMKASRDATLKEVHFDDVRLLPPTEQLELLYEFLGDPDSSFLRHLALSEFNALEARKHFIIRDLPHDADYYVQRRDDADFRAQLLESAVVSRVGWDVVL